METRWQLSKECMFLVSAFFVLFMSGGLILGFGPVYSMLVREKLWVNVCSKEEQQNRNEDSGVLCAAQEVYLQSVFSTAFLSLSASNVFFGVFLDVMGPRGTIVLALLLSTCGNFALALVQTESSGLWIIAGYSLVAIGGMGVYLAAFQMLQLFNVQGLVCSTLSSLFNCSGFVYVLLGLHGMTRTNFFCGYGILASVCAFVGYLLFPTNNINRPSEFLAIPLLHFELPRNNTPAFLVDGLQEMLKRQDLWLLAVLFGWVSLTFAFTGGALPSLLSKLAGDDISAASLYTNVIYPIVVNSTFCYSPIVGYVIDHYGFKMVFVACIVLVQLLIVLLLVPSLQVQLITFFVFAMAQSCLYSL
uniref:MFS transporter n=1 Tax=Peronospora matthiolae TaxID=2874970 RepID=A0AAV1TIH6_9STRA